MCWCQHRVLIRRWFRKFYNWLSLVQYLEKAKIQTRARTQQEVLREIVGGVSQAEVRRLVLLDNRANRCHKCHSKLPVVYQDHAWIM